MTELTKTVAMVLLALWVPAVCHCDLERLPGLQFLSCCQHLGTAPHQDNDCEEDDCAVVESGFYQMEKQSAGVPSPLLLPRNLLPPQGITIPAEVPGWLRSTTSPPELPRIWQFNCRTARSPRAPSLAG